MITRRRYVFTGIVQGVGFRPLIARLAAKHSITGWIQNRSGSVLAEFTGTSGRIDSLLGDLQENPPALARLDPPVLEYEGPAAVPPESGFRILQGAREQSGNVLIPPDMAVCGDCLSEIMDARNRRFSYPFTTCVNCGPRYTVITGMPYERENTTMRDFPLCRDCLSEYEDPSNRRFHAESTACPQCGPGLELLEFSSAANCWTGRKLESDHPSAAVTAARLAISDGKIVAVKGLGGFLLAVSAGRPEAIKELRKRKCRPHKPFAVMARSMKETRKFFEVNDQEEALLSSPQAPIVVLRSRKIHTPLLSMDMLNTDTDTVGVMLPTSPLHTLLLEQGVNDPVPPFDFIVMTSGNRRSEPICLSTKEAMDRLAGIADLILTHNRGIALRNDDSLCMVHSTGPQVWRRARGFAPAPIRLHRPLSRHILAMGSEIKNTVAIGYGNEAVVSPHIGDLETPEAIEQMKKIAKTLPEFLNKQVEAVAVDLNEDMHSSRAGRAIAGELGVPAVAIQHHEAHAMACLAEHGLYSGLALTFDGTGLGKDGTVWGAELFGVKDGRCTRLAAFRPAPLPGGDSAVRRPVRQLIGRLIQAGTDLNTTMLSDLGLTAEQVEIWKQQVTSGLNTPVSSGAGRLFDAMAVLLGCAPAEISYEGQPAVRLEHLAGSCRSAAPDKDILFSSGEVNDVLLIDWTPFFASVKNIAQLRKDAAVFAMSFHLAVVNAAETMLHYGLARQSDSNIALCGGVFMNRIITSMLAERISSMGLNPVIHSLVPPNDGCISFGQLVQAELILEGD